MSAYLRASIAAPFLTRATLTGVAAMTEIQIQLYDATCFWLNRDDVAALLFPTKEDRP